VGIHHSQGQTHVLNKIYSPFSAPGWNGITINYQMDGDYKQTPYTVYVDNLNFTYQRGVHSAAQKGLSDLDNPLIETEIAYRFLKY